VLGVSVDFNGANQAWAEKLGLTFPLVADTRREISRAYGVLNDNPALLQDSKRIAGYLRAKRAWFVIDKAGIIRYAQVGDPRGLMPNDEILEVVNKYR
jgi:peroxiredoxin